MNILYLFYDTTDNIHIHSHSYHYKNTQESPTA